MKISVSVDAKDVVERLGVNSEAIAEMDGDYVQGSLEGVIAAVLSELVFDIDYENAEIASVTYLGDFRDRN